MYILVTVGASSSGKTTYAVNEVKKSRGMTVNVNRDDIRKQLFSIQGWGEYTFNSERESLVTATQTKMIEAAILAGKNIIVSDTNLKPEYRARFEQIAKDNNYEYKELWFKVSLDELKSRNMFRDSWSVSEQILERMHSDFESQLDGTQVVFEPSTTVLDLVYNGDTSLPNAVIFDTDGTTATMVNRKPFEWDKVGTDLPRYNVINHAIDLKKRGIKIINLSGRDGVCKQLTRDWYDRVGMPCDDHFQRKEGDQRPDDIIKKEILFDEIAKKYNILYVVDDRQKVVDMWRSIGLECWQVNSGRF